MTSVVIAAHNEESVIGRCLDALLAHPVPGGLDITVVANGCTDATAEVAASRPAVRVLTLSEAGKPAALNAGDAVAAGFPRVYLDADVVLRPGALSALVAALDDPGTAGVAPLAVVPRRVLDVAGRPFVVRAFYSINSRLPAYHHALFGRGVIALSAVGRTRFDSFPDLTADDLFLDALFAPHEKAEVEQAVSVVATPRRTRDLIARLIRVRAGNAAIRAATAIEPGRSDAPRSDAPPSAGSPAVRRAVRTSWLRDVVLPRPWLVPAAACYVAITMIAALAARRRLAGGVVPWGHDASTRPTVVPGPHPRPALSEAESPK